MPTNLIDNRQIRIFISSTFQDMQDERDYLFNNVFPRIRKIAEKRDVRVVEIDLRWAITYEESASGKVMQICFDEIENCRPYFIGILGDRYGWCPDISELQKNPNIELSYPWVKDYILKGRSITEMEMQLGALDKALNTENELKASFYIKQDSPLTSKEQKMLKQIVRENADSPFYEYSTPKELGLSIEKNLLQLLDDLYPQSECSLHEIEVGAQRAALHHFAYGVYPKRNIISRLHTFLDSEKRYLVLHGDKGCGKTATLAYFINDYLNNQDEYQVFYFFVGESAGSDCKSYVRYTITCLAERFDILDASENYDDFARFTYNVCEGRKVLFVIDGVDKFNDSYINPIKYLPKVPQQCKVIVSCETSNLKNTDCAHIMNDDLYFWEHQDCVSDYMYVVDSLNGKHPDDGEMGEYIRDLLHMPLLSRKDIEEITKLSLRIYGKKLTANELERVSRDVKSKHPDTLRKLISSILYLHTPEELAQHICDYEQMVDSNSYVNFVLDSIERVYGSSIVRDYLSQISVTRNGIPEYDLKMVMNYDQVRFSQIHYALAEHIRNKSGYLIIEDKELANVVINRYVSDNEHHFRKKLIDYYSRDLSVIDKNSKMWIREYPYQCLVMKDYENLYSCVVEPQVCLADLSVLGWALPSWEYYMGEILNYWRALLKADKGYSLDIYFKNPADYIERNSLSMCYFIMVAYFLEGTDTALKYSKEANDIYTSYGHNYTPALLFIKMMMSELYKQNDDSNNAHKVLREGLDICNDVITSGNICSYLSNILRELDSAYNDECEKMSLYEYGDKICSKVYLSNSYAYVHRELLIKMAYLYKKNGDFQNALNSAKKAMEISQEFKGLAINGGYISETNYGFDNYTYASILYEKGDFPAAKGYCLKALEIYNSSENMANVNMKAHIQALLTNINQGASIS